MNNYAGHEQATFMHYLFHIKFSIHHMFDIKYPKWKSMWNSSMNSNYFSHIDNPEYWIFHVSTYKCFL
jgi:hypothetical protein